MADFKRRAHLNNTPPGLSAMLNTGGGTYRTTEMIGLFALLTEAQKAKALKVDWPESFGPKDLRKEASA